MASASRYTLPPPQDFRLPSLKDLNFQYRSRPPPQDDTPQDNIPPARHVNQWARTQQQPSPPLSAAEQYASKHDQGGYLTPGVPMSLQQQQQPQQQSRSTEPKQPRPSARSSSRQSQASPAHLSFVPPATCFVARPRMPLRRTRLLPRTPNNRNQPLPLRPRTRNSSSRPIAILSSSSSSSNRNIYIHATSSRTQTRIRHLVLPRSPRKTRGSSASISFSSSSRHSSSSSSKHNNNRPRSKSSTMPTGTRSRSSTTRPCPASPPRCLPRGRPNSMHRRRGSMRMRPRCSRCTRSSSSSRTLRPRRSSTRRMASTR
ncbi:hypothetical protein C8F04DRAFT_1111153 [Mycena alexandri]|uniref:Uncharacterized protein n=1 Tax=Mycena alexandri TaxID=1745969 RepID=A0AAD6X0M1_9AGAR|nr:hypothetical protein C8F04DRAFT_1111153 [Mycena alexandri]